MPFGIGHPPPTHQLQSTCVGEGSRVPNLQTEFNYLNSFKSYGIFSDFVVPKSPLSSRHPCHPHVVPIAPRRSPCGLHGLWSPHVVPVVPTLSPRHARCPHSPQKVPMWSPWSVVSTCCPHHPHVVPVIATSSRRSPHHPQSPKYPVHPSPTPWGGWGPRISKNAIRFELIKIF